jgi:hypothetical protein
VLAGAHRILGIVSRRRTVEQAGTVGRLPSMRQRRAWARGCSGCSRRSAAARPGGSPPTPSSTSHRACAARSSGPAGPRCWPLRRSWSRSGSPSRPPPSGSSRGSSPSRASRHCSATTPWWLDGPRSSFCAASSTTQKVDRDCQAFSGLLAMDAPIAWSTSPASPGSRRFPFSFRAPLGAGGRARWWPWVHPDPTGLMSAWCPPTTPRDSADAVRAPWLCSIPTWMASSTTSPADFQPHTTLSMTTNPPHRLTPAARHPPSAPV